VRRATGLIGQCRLSTSCWSRAQLGFGLEHLQLVETPPGSGPWHLAQADQKTPRDRFRPMRTFSSGELQIRS